MVKKAQRPIDVKDTLWSVLGKDALDAAAERVWDLICDEVDADIYPYNWDSEVQITAQRVVYRSTLIGVNGTKLCPVCAERDLRARYENGER